jgi:hypothetical protein
MDKARKADRKAVVRRVCRMNELTLIRADNARLRAAIRPFAEAFPKMRIDAYPLVNIEHWEAAANALSASETRGGK